VIAGFLIATRAGGDVGLLPRPGGISIEVQA
jgi:hypothetical protein